MPIRVLTDKGEIEAVLRRNPALHLYGLGDLDDFFWPHTTWFARAGRGAPDDLILLYTGFALPTVLALSDRPAAMRDLFQAVLPNLPDRFYAHLSPGVEAALEPTHRAHPYGTFMKMILSDRSRIAEVNPEIDGAPIARLEPGDLAEVVEFYKESYPGNWFDPRMLETGQYFGLRHQGRLASIAGVHVYSQRYRVSALGNIATLPAARNQGFGRRVTTRLCRSLIETVDHVGLNVKADNAPAVTCYRRLAFEPVALFGEFLVEANTVAPGPLIGHP